MEAIQKRDPHRGKGYTKTESKEKPGTDQDN
jgi:hypothetical protein